MTTLGEVLPGTIFEFANPVEASNSAAPFMKIILKNPYIAIADSQDQRVFKRGFVSLLTGEVWRLQDPTGDGRKITVFGQLKDLIEHRDANET